MTAANDIRVEHGRKRVRILLAGELVADSTRPLLVWEHPYYPTYYIPAADVRAKLVPAGAYTDAHLGEAEVLTVEVPGGATASARPGGIPRARRASSTRLSGSSGTR